MDTSNEENDDFTFYSEVRSSRRASKEKLLDDSFRKAEKSKGIQNDDFQELIKNRPFLKLGVLLIIVGIFALIIINIVPWMFIRFEAEYGTINAFYYNDLEPRNGGYYLEIDNIFESKCTNCSDYSKNFIGLTKDDFSNIPSTCSIASYILIVVGVIFTIIEILDKKFHYFYKIIKIIHSSFSTAGIIFGSFLIYLNIKFLSVHFLAFYNTQFIETSGANNVIFLFLAPLLLIILSLGILVICLVLININLRKYAKKRKLEAIPD